MFQAIVNMIPEEAIKSKINNAYDKTINLKDGSFITFIPAKESV